MSRGKDDVTKGVPARDPAPVPAPVKEPAASGSRRRRSDGTRRIDTAQRQEKLAGEPGPTRVSNATGASLGARLITGRGPSPQLGDGQLPRPVKLRHVTGQHEFQPEETKSWGRYEVGQVLGRGGMGVVQLVRDTDLGRHVALKSLHADDPERASLEAALMAEAQTTGQLEHPNIIPVYELGALPTGEVFYTMKAVSGQTLKDILRRLRDGDAGTEREYSRRRLLNIFGQICQAMHYAHSRGVVHRDLKPDNVMLGSYGEVLVMDWGIAYCAGNASDPLARPGLVVGTPHYMSPEQARGQISHIDGRADIYSLGVILYEILTYSLPITETDTERALEQVRAQIAPPRPRADADGKRVPEVLADLCEEAMATLPSDRIPTAREMYNRLEAYLEGSAERERRSAMAAAELAVGVQALDHYKHLRRGYGRLEQEVAERERSVYRWDAQEKKRELADMRARHGHLAFQVSQAFSEAVNHFHRVLGLVPDHPYARSALANLYWSRFEDAEATGDYEDMIYFADLVLRLNDAERGPIPQGDGRVTARSFPEGANIYLFDFSQGVPETRPEAGRHLGVAPVTVELPVGMYLLVAQKEGYRDAHHPIFVRAGAHQTSHLSLHGWATGEKLVGREGELGLLQMNFDRSVVGRQVRRVLVTGSDGIGKSRLLTAFNDYVENLDEVVLFFFAECHEPHTLVPYAPITEALQIRAGIEPRDERAVVADKLRAMIETAVELGGPPTLRDRDHITDIVYRLCWLPGMIAEERPPDVGPREMRERLDRALLDFIQIITRWDAALFFFQEVEYLDDASARILRLAPKFLTSTPLFVLGFASDVSHQTGWDERVVLRPIGDTGVDALLRKLLKGPLPPGLHQRVMTVSRGVPWLVGDAVRRLAMAGDLSLRAGRWHLRDDLSPPVETTMLEARQRLLDELPGHLAAALRAAAVVGDRFWSETLEAMGIEDAEAICGELMAREFIRAMSHSRYSGTHAYAFRSVLFREVVYESIDPEVVPGMHGRVADWMRARLVGDPREVAELALHVEHAKDEPWAALLFSQLGDVCRAAGCFGMARECYVRALAASYDPDDRAAIQARLQAVSGRHRP